MFIKGEMFERLLCCRRKVVEEDEAERGVEQVVLQHTNNNQTEYITSAQLVEVIMTLLLLLAAVSPAAGEMFCFVEGKSFFSLLQGTIIYWRKLVLGVMYELLVVYGGSPYAPTFSHCETNCCFCVAGT